MSRPSMLRSPTPSTVPRAFVVCSLVVSGALVSGCAESAAPAECGADDASEVCQVFQLVNQERAAAGVAPYAWNAELALAAQRHADDMIANDYFDHESLDGRSFSDRAREAGYDASPRGENIARGQRTPEQVMDSWMGSGGHRANILAEGSNEIGVGFLDFTWVQVFGARAAED